MAVFFYNIFLWLYVAGIRIASIWDVKARKWLRGREKIFNDIQSAIDSRSKTIWVHCSSLGEFEQGQPVIAEIRDRFPDFKLLVTFFSPSGFEVKKNYSGADYIFYLPMDSPRNARKFLALVNPCLVMFVKYDYWYHYLSELKKRKINCLLISAVFRPGQSFFKWYGILQRSMLRCFTHLFVQDEQSKELLETINVKDCSVSGDTRFDRVADIAAGFEPIPIVESFIGSGKCVVAGSTWKEDEELLQQAVVKLNDANLKLVIAPHEIDNSHLKELKYLFPASTQFSSLASYNEAGSARSANTPSNILIIDNVGMLSRIYKYAYLAYVGGGFTADGVHNVLEAAVYGKPVVFGPNYKKYKEAADLINYQGAKTFSNAGELMQTFWILLNNEKDYNHKCEASRRYVEENVGATKKILSYIEEKRLLTS